MNVDQSATNVNASILSDTKGRVSFDPLDRYNISNKGLIDDGKISNTHSQETANFTAQTIIITLTELILGSDDA